MYTNLVLFGALCYIIFVTGVTYAALVYDFNKGNWDKLKNSPFWVNLLKMHIAFFASIITLIVIKDYTGYFILFAVLSLLVAITMLIARKTN